MSSASDKPVAPEAQADCADCGGIHFGTAFCPFTRCSICGVKTKLACSDCQIDLGTIVLVCVNSKCRARHEACYCTKRSHPPASGESRKHENSQAFGACWCGIKHSEDAAERSARLTYIVEITIDQTAENNLSYVKEHGISEDEITLAVADAVSEIDLFEEAVVGAALIRKEMEGK